ncbi:hypothetical protein [Pseudogemmobacter bohemicus]|uniref:hypothetical protein n=1 Tax=Pseudogemmobacter bohemicus TaxID=2250708 RepID=UPI0013001D5F|nr:hypothetical protein [Pseudogemmobacter bohemicus]
MLFIVLIVVVFLVFMWVDWGEIEWTPNQRREGREYRRKLTERKLRDEKASRRIAVERRKQIALEQWRDNYRRQHSLPPYGPDYLAGQREIEAYERRQAEKNWERNLAMKEHRASLAAARRRRKDHL